MQTDLFDYPLPEELIARVPAARRDRSRLLVFDRKSGKITHSEFACLPEFLPQGARLFRNNATVLKARLRAQRRSGSPAECLLLRPAKAEDLAYFSSAGNGAGNGSGAGSGSNAGGGKNAASGAANDPEGRPQEALSPWDFICLLKPGKRLKPGDTFYREGHFSALVLDKHPSGENRVRFTPLRGQQSVVEIATLAGELPLPPYIEQARLAEHGTAAPSAADSAASHAADDAERYQTVYADPARTVAAAAPTAGLHFTPELLATLAQQGVPAYDLTLHVGLDTFRPISTERIEEHQIHRELYEIPAATAAALEPLTGRPRVAVGTTTLRSIEHYFRQRGSANGNGSEHGSYSGNGSGNVSGNGNGKSGAPWIAEADIFIYPPARFAGVEALITNFHLPRSTLLCLVSAFLTPGSTDGIEQLKALYREAIDLRYRFFSYGDAMLIL